MSWQLSPYVAFSPNDPIRRLVKQPETGRQQGNVCSVIKWSKYVGTRSRKSMVVAGEEEEGDEDNSSKAFDGGYLIWKKTF